MAEQMQPMPDVPKRCWYCEREMTIETIRVECAYCGADVARAYEWLDALDAARAEAERWRKKYEALRAEVESVAQELRKRAYSCAKDWLETGHRYHDGASDAYYEAEQMVRRVLAEAG